MTHQHQPDHQTVVSLHHVLQQFPLSEEQIWSLAHQSFVSFRDHFRPNLSLLVTSADQLLLTSDGRVHPDSLCSVNDIDREVARSQHQLLARFGVVLFRALDFGLSEDEERSLSRPLEALIEALTAASEDEGFCDVTHDFDDLIEKCVSRFGRDGAPDHYRAVTRALVLESRELSTFLERVQDKESPGEEEAEQLVLEDWLKNWIAVVRQLRQGVKLKHVQHDESRAHSEYTLTPYEMLLHDIRHKNYKLSHVTRPTATERKDGEKDAHALILEFIRSRPPLLPASRRQLREAPERESSAFERLMKSIRDNDWKLRPTPVVTWQSQEDVQQEAVVDRKQMTKSCIPQRRLIKANLNLHLNDLDDSDSDDDTRRQNLDTTGSGQPAVKSRKFSLRGLSLNLRRRSLHDATTTPLDVNEDTRNHVAQIWEASEWGRTLQCLSLTLQEVKHFRSVLTKAEMESLSVTKELREDLLRARICFTCLKTRFSFFGARPNTCKVCERAICDRCASRMHIPCEHFDKVPIYMLSPTPSPPELRPEVETGRATEVKRGEESGKKTVVSGPLVRVCRDCKRLVRHLIDTGTSATLKHSYR